MVPINLEKEYDRVPREVMWWILEASRFLISVLR